MSLNSSFGYKEGIRLVLATIALGLALLGPGIKTGVDDVLVWVNRQPITQEDLEQTQSLLRAGSAQPLNDSARQRLLQLMVDEALMVQRAERLRLFHHDPGLRKLLVQAAIDDILAAFLERPMTEKELRSYFDQHPSVFEKSGTLRLSAYAFDSYPEVAAARERLATGESLHINAARFLPIPQGPLPISRLHHLIGPTLAQQAKTMNPGEISPPIVHGEQYVLLSLHQKTPVVLPAFDSIQAQVRSEYQRRGRDQALASKLDALWASAHININHFESGK
jgi:parvulin-like peptidyl-prolyl isomerase